MSKQSGPVDAEAIAIIAQAAELPLEPGRAEVIAKPLAAWLRDANDLNRKMSQAKHLDIIPATIFHQVRG